MLFFSQFLSIVSVSEINYLLQLFILSEVPTVVIYWVQLTLWNDHTHTHPFNGPFSRTTRVGRYQKGKTNLDFTEARASEWQWHQLGICKSAPRSRQNNHASTSPLSFLQAGCPSCCPTNSVKALLVKNIWLVISKTFSVMLCNTEIMCTHYNVKAVLGASITSLHCWSHKMW